MATESGYDVFANALVNQQFKKILAYWHSSWSARNRGMC